MVSDDMRKRVSSKDVAELAGVSRATVSYVLNDSSTQTIPEATRKKVLEAAEKLGYFPNRQARTLKTKKTDCICVMAYQNIELPGPAAMIQGIRSVLNRHGYTILLCSKEKRNSKPYPEYIHAYLENDCDGIILLGYDQGTGFEEYADVIRKYQVPFVMINPERFYDDFYTVSGETITRQEEIISLSVSEGYREFAYFFPEHPSEKEKERMESFTALCGKHGYICRTIEFPAKIDTRLSTIQKGSDDDDRNAGKDPDSFSRIRELFAGKEQQTCLVFPWQQLASSLLPVFADGEDSPAVAVLGGARPEESLYAVYGGKVLFADMQYQKLGEAAAEKMIRILDDRKTEKQTIIPAFLRVYN